MQRAAHGRCERPWRLKLAVQMSLCHALPNASPEDFAFVIARCFVIQPPRSSRSLADPMGLAYYPKSWASLPSSSRPREFSKSTLTRRGPPLCILE